jgi:hypothetical protein
MDSVMKNLLVAAAVAALVIAVSPAFAGLADEAEMGYSTYPPVGQCHFVKEAVTMANGHVFTERFRSATEDQREHVCVLNGPGTFRGH